MRLRIPSVLIVVTCCACGVSADPSLGALDDAGGVLDAATHADAGALPLEPTTDAGDEADAALHEPDFCAQMAARAGVSLPGSSGVSWARLLCDTLDLTRFTRAPDVPYQAKLASSYDRASTREGESGWYANTDRGMYLRAEGDEHVMMEDFGPGAITRLWSPTPSGRLRIYIDDRDEPALDVDMREFLSGSFEAPWGSPFVFVAGEGYSAYFPIPYGHYARVSTTTSEALYYQVDYRSYPEGVAVESFSRAGLSALAPLAQELARLIEDPAREPALSSPRELSLAFDDAHHERATQLEPSVIRELSLEGFRADEGWLRATRLIMLVDGERSIDAPIGDLFGSGQGLNPHVSRVSSVSERTLSLRWPMPVRGEVRFRLESNGGELGSLSLRMRYTPGLPTGHRLFRARWTGVQTFDTENPLDWTPLHTMGQGWYVGTLLNITNASPAWWGEGDEKIFVDGEAWPSHFGTGTEDYFGFGWCSNETFSEPWIGQTRADGPLNWGRASMYRWHIPDAMPFERELRFKLEVQHWVQSPFSSQLAQDVIVVWYAEPGVPQPIDSLADAAFTLAPLTSAKPLLPGGPFACK
ncbi:MAG: DUF2961 domain-containing protein [Myxococcales bacterium]